MGPTVRPVRSVGRRGAWQSPSGGKHQRDPAPLPSPAPRLVSRPPDPAPITNSATGLCFGEGGEISRERHMATAQVRRRYVHTDLSNPKRSPDFSTQATMTSSQRMRHANRHGTISGRDRELSQHEGNI